MAGVKYMYDQQGDELLGYLRSLVVVAFDIGTTYSGYAFSFKNDPLSIKTNQNWVAGGGDTLMSRKTPTCLLIDQKNQFHSFGYDAENKYSSLAEDGLHTGWRLFRRFKMRLYNDKGLSRESTVEDISGKSAAAMTIFALFIHHMRKHFLDAIDRMTSGIKETDIRYIITVPAIWDDRAKQFMREAAIKAGISADRLNLALEPEAASIWCQIPANTHLSQATNSTDEHGSADLSRPGISFMVIDLGGGTVDVSVHKRQPDGTLKELHSASGGPWGGTCVDVAFERLIEQIFGDGVVEQLKTEEMVDYLDMIREFETKKRSVTSSSEERITLKVSCTLADISRKRTGQSLKNRLASLNCGDAIVLRSGDKLRLDPALLRKLFDWPIKRAIEHAKKLLNVPKLINVDALLLVGGFSESHYVQDRFKAEIKNKRLIVPSEAGLAVLKGAVTFGHDPKTVASRIMTYTYGVECRHEFVKGVHPEDKVQIVNGKAIVNGCFSIYATKGDEVPTDYQVTRGNNIPLDPRSHTVVLRVYRSTDFRPVLVTDSSCEMLGKLQIALPESRSDQDKAYDIIFIFGDTELIVKARMCKTGRERNRKFDCL